MLKIPVILGSVRRGRQSGRVARFARGRLRRAGTEAPLLDLAEIGLPVMEERLSKRDDPPPGLVAFAGAVAEADAIVVVSPEYNGAVPGALKNALDYLHGEWERKPVGVVTTSAGGFGGVHAQTQLQLLFLRLRALPVAAMPVSRVSQSFDEDGEPKEAHYETSFARFCDTLTWYARAIGRGGEGARGEGGPGARRGMAPRPPKEAAQGSASPRRAE